MSVHRSFLSGEYAEDFLKLTGDERLNPLDAGTPNHAARPLLDKLSPESSFKPHRVQDSHMAMAAISGVWLYHNFLEESHKISQDIPTPTGSYWHAIMHRREPDFWNSKYWFKRVGDHPVFGLLQQAAKEIVPEFEPRPEFAFIIENSRWDPFVFVDLCELCATGKSPAVDLCKKIQLAEWQLLFDFSYRNAIG